MKTFTHYLVMHTQKEKEFVNITSQVQETVKKSGIIEGLCLINSMHITSSIFINDGEFEGRRDKRVLIKIIGA